MIRLIRTNSSHKDFIHLVKFLNAYLAEKDGDEHSFYDQYNQLDSIKYVVMAYENDEPAGCGAIKEFNQESMEVKRMYTSPEHRNKGIAGKILNELENWTAELGYQKCVLETGKRQVEAVRFYKKSGYLITPNYGQYQGMENSICFEKQIVP